MSEGEGKFADVIVIMNWEVLCCYLLEYTWYAKLPGWENIEEQGYENKEAKGKVR